MPKPTIETIPLPEWVHLAPGPMGTIYCAVIAGACSPPYSSASEAIRWGQEQIWPVVKVTEDVATAAWGSRVVGTLHRCGRAA